MRKLLFALIISILPFVAWSQAINVSGSIGNNTTWYVDTVKMIGDIIVEDGVTLTIEPGVYVEAQGYYSIDVKGRILAIGTETDSIVFTVNDTTNFYLHDTILGGWNGIHFDSTSVTNDSSKFKYCKIQFGKAVAPAFTHYSDFDGGGIFMYYFSKVLIQYCNLSYNYAYGNGGAISCYHASPCIRENYFYQNNGNAHGGGICSNKDSIFIIENTFYKNRTGG